MLNIKNLCATIHNKEILKNVNLIVNAGEVHVIMGPNGSGKSTLANVLAGNNCYDNVSGNVEFCNADLLAMPVEQRATAGLFLAFQYPVEIPGVNNLHFLKTALNNVRKARNLPELDAFDFLELIKTKSSIAGIDEKFLDRQVNVGFSGGEKKRNEILQMLLLEPKLAILDEPDSGLDIDALQAVATGINSLRHPERAIIIVTHYQRLLDYVVPDFIHILYQGHIVKSGGKEIAHELEQKGYGWLTDK